MTTGGRLATQVVLTVSAFAIPRVLGAESFGLFAALMAVLAILQSAAAFGLPFVEVRYLAPLWSAGARSEALALASSIWVARGVLALAGSAGVVLWLAASPGLGVSPRLCALVAAAALLRFVFESARSLLLPLGRVGQVAAFDFARAALTLPIAIGLFPGFGLDGVFAGLSLMHTGLLALCWAALWRVAPLGAARPRWAALRPHLGYATASFVGSLAAMFQTQFAVFAVANWVTRQEAAYLGIAVQLYALLQVLFINGRRSLMPVLSEFEVRGETRRLAHWGGVLLRYWTAALCLALVSWALLGRDIVRILLTDAFAPVFPCATAILVAVLFYCAAASCNGLSYVRGRAWTASASAVLYAGLTVLGLLLALRGDASGASFRIACAYAAAAAAFFASAWLALGVAGDLWLPLGRAGALMAPALLAWPAALWEAPLPLRLLAAGGFLAGYAALALVLRLLPAEELREIARALRA